MSSVSPYPQTPRQLAEWLERVPVELLQHLPGAAAGELARRLAEAQARAAGTEEAVRLATPITAAKYAEEVGLERGTPARWARPAMAGRGCGWSARTIPPTMAVEAELKG